MATSENLSSGVAALARQIAVDKVATDIEINSLKSGKANLVSPTFTGTPQAPTPEDGDSSANIATTEFVQRALSSGGDSAVANGLYAAFTSFNQEHGIA